MKKVEMISLTNVEKKLHRKRKVCYICKKVFSTDNKKYQKVRVHCNYTGKYRGAAHDNCNLRYKISKETRVVFHNGSIYDYKFIIKDLPKELESQFECLGENTENYVTFSVLIKKELDNRKTITCKIKFLIVLLIIYQKFIRNLSDSLSKSQLKI